MMGVKFHGQLDLRRILAYPEFEWAPAPRRIYPADRTQPLVRIAPKNRAGLPLGKLAPFQERRRNGVRAQGLDDESRALLENRTGAEIDKDIDGTDRH